MSIYKPHTPVLLNEMLQYVSPKAGELYLDCTFGAGGYTNALLEAADCKVYGVDQDDTVEHYAQPIYEKFPERFKLFIDKFSKIYSLFAGTKVDAIILDIGVSSMQLEEANRGFSFMLEGPLDMRMSQQKTKYNAMTLVNTYREKELADIIYKYSDERYSRKIAAAIVNYRNKKLISTTTEIANIIRSVLPGRQHSNKIDPATRTFQAIRIWVNDELQELEKAIDAASKLLNIGGRLVIISFHSLEDTIVKRKFKYLCGKVDSPSRHSIQIENKPPIAIFKPLHKKIIQPTQQEIRFNPKARSARLRAISKIL